MLRTSEEDPALTVHWFGHIKPAKFDKMEKSLWRPTWFQPKDARIYYAAGILHSEHVPYTNVNTSTNVRESDVICWDLKLTKDWHMNIDSAHRCLIAINQVIQDLPDPGDGIKFRSL